MMGDLYLNAPALWPFFCWVVWWLCRVCRCRLIDGLLRGARLCGIVMVTDCCFEGCALI